MEPELADYICTYCTQFYNEKERKAADHYFGQIKYAHVTDDYPDPWKRNRDRFITQDPEALILLKDGYEQFKLNTAERIYWEHRHELNLNLCPRCQQIARTPQAKQCRFCRHDWH